jgi:tetratricopeptide (TPR) repeat protein
VRRPPRLVWLALIFAVCAAVGGGAAGRARARAAFERGDLATAISIQDRLAWLGLDDAEQRYALGRALVEQGRIDEAVVQYERGLARSPTGPQWAALAALHVRQDDPEAAIAAWQAGFETNGDVRYLHRASNLLRKRGDRERAFAFFEQAALVDPSSVQVHLKIAAMAQQLGLPGEQIRHLRAALAFEPERASLRSQLAWALSTSPDEKLRSPVEAVSLAEPLVQETGRSDAELLDLLAAAYAAAGRFDDAVLTAAEARDLALRENAQPLATALVERRELYRSGRSYVEPLGAG